MKKKFIVFTIDKGYLPHLATALRSFVETNDSSQYEIGLIYSGINQKSINKLLAFAHQIGLELFAEEIYEQFTDVHVSFHFNHTIFYRFLAPELFNGYEQILYLDSDIIFMGDVSEIFELDLNCRVLGAVDRAPYFGVPSYLVGMIDRYLASGLLLINREKFICDKVKERCIQFLKNHYYEMPDQDALSYVVRDFVPIDPRFSVETAFLCRSESLFDFAKNPKIIQFSGSSKPWNMDNNHPYKRLYWRYRNKTPYRSFLPDDFCFKDAIRRAKQQFGKNLVRKVIGKRLR